MKNKYLEKLEKLEFVVTYACSGRCRHCSEGDHVAFGERIDPEFAAEAVRRISAVYGIKTVLAFGGEPLLYTNATYAIITAARDMNIPKRQIITNGYFTKSKGKMRRVAEELYDCGVNDLLISVDAFHEECIPIEAVRSFASEAVSCGIPVRLQPAWLVSRTDCNPYNKRTREILDDFSDMNIPEGEGNVVYLEGNAKKYLAEYFVDSSPENPYTEDPCRVKCLSFEPNGKVLGGNIYDEDVMEIIKNYDPKSAW